MDFAQHQRNPARHLVGVGGVILLHVVIIYALITGLARKVVEVVKGPIDVKVIEVHDLLAGIAGAGCFPDFSFGLANLRIVAAIERSAKTEHWEKVDA